mgnify:CR=1 FL=1
MMSEKRKVTVDGDDYEVKIEREGDLWKVEVGGKEFSITLEGGSSQGTTPRLSLIHISEPTRRTPISYAVFC